MIISVNEDKRTLSRDGNSFFYLADTCWSAFSNIRENEWLSYLRKRKSQGFNSLQINILPQWDRSQNEYQILPFDLENGIFNFNKINETYFERAERMCEIANQQGFTLSLVVLWSNYVSGTWASELDENKNIFPEQLLEDYFERILKYFDKFNPIYVIGGDTDFLTETSIKTYKKALDYFKENSIESLRTIHVRGRLNEIPKELTDDMDLYFYQSGHNSSYLDMPFILADNFYRFIDQKPIINSEPCYEQMGFSRKVYGRFGQKDVRRAAWQSILSGACAGVTYGAHGIWSWHSDGSNFNGDIGEAFDSPLFWQDALYLPGASDYGYLKSFLKLNTIYNLIPCNEILLKGDKSIRIAEASGGEFFIIYIPSNTSIKLKLDLTNFDVTLLDFSDYHFYSPEYSVFNGETTFPISFFKEDAIIFARKNNL